MPRLLLASLALAAGLLLFGAAGPAGASTSPTASKPWTSANTQKLERLARQASCVRTEVRRVRVVRGGRDRIVRMRVCVASTTYSQTQTTPRSVTGYRERFMPASFDCSSYAGWLVHHTLGFDIGNGGSIWTGSIVNNADAYADGPTRNNPPMQLFQYRSPSQLRPGDILVTRNSGETAAHAVVYLRRQGARHVITQSSVQWARYKNTPEYARIYKRRTGRDYKPTVAASGEAGAGYVTVDDLQEYFNWYYKKHM
jgi:cell wall-associated NlpC family hydrolase